MRYLALVFSLLLITPSLAQNTAYPASSTRRVSNARVSGTDFESLQLQKEHELKTLMNQYESIQPAFQKDVKTQIQRTLYTLFDLGITKKELQAHTLKVQLASLEEDESFSERSQELASLRLTLIEVESSLKFRRKNRDRIVNQRLGEMLE